MRFTCFAMRAGIANIIPPNKGGAFKFWNEDSGQMMTNCYLLICGYVWAAISPSPCDIYVGTVAEFFCIAKLREELLPLAVKGQDHRRRGKWTSWLLQLEFLPAHGVPRSQTYKLMKATGKSLPLHTPQRCCWGASCTSGKHMGQSSCNQSHLL